ncbi:MAG: SRPBCC domain-containing protein [Spirosomataceae bacterium]
MNTTLLFDFSVNKATNTIHVKREFNGSLPLVWKTWTTPELLDQWWGPQPCRAQTKTMDFREGGHWLYAMIIPDGAVFWSKVEYLSIQAEQSFTANDGFCDEHGIMNPDFPQNTWQNTFISKGNKVEVDILLTFDTLADLQKTLDMGFKEGFSVGLQQLDSLLLTLSE